MIDCKECGYSYPDNFDACPECGNPTALSVNKTGHTSCPNCGAPISNSVSCEYCGTVFPKEQPIVQYVQQPQNNDTAVGTAAAAFVGGLIGGALS